MKLLVCRGADVNYCTLDYSDSSPLHLAVTKLHVEVVKVRTIMIMMIIVKSTLTPPLFILLSPSSMFKWSRCVDLLFIWQFTKSSGKVSKLMKRTLMVMNVLVMMSTISTCIVVVKLSVLICHRV